MWNSLFVHLDHLMTIQAVDAEVQRRGRLLSILLLGSLMATSLLTAINLAQFVNWPSPQIVVYLLLDLACSLVVMGLLYWNRAGHTRWASYSFLLVCVVRCTLSVNPWLRLYFHHGPGLVVYDRLAGGS
jgi:hypothetical protein